jgi:YVTN family beta-propeller protein
MANMGQLDQLGFNTGAQPYYISINQDKHRLYIANYLSSTVDVIDGLTDKVINNITVGNYPNAIDINKFTNTIYVANDESNTVSIIDGSKNVVVNNVAVGMNPEDLAVDTNEGELNSLIFVANYGSNTVSVIDGLTNRIISNILVGHLPFDVAISPKDHIVFITNLGSQTISEINATSNKLLAGIRFNINPPDTGYIKCNGSEISGSYVRYQMSSHLQCQAIPNKVYRFSSWSGNLASASNNTDTDIMSLKVLGYGTLTANFVVPASISIPQQYLLPLYGLIPSFLIPSFAAWLNARRRSKHFRECMTEIEKLPDRIDYDNKDEYLQYTDTIKELKREISKKIGARKISDSHYNILNNKILEYEMKINNDFNVLKSKKNDTQNKKGNNGYNQESKEDKKSSNEDL